MHKAVCGGARASGRTGGDVGTQLGFAAPQVVAVFSWVKFGNLATVALSFLFDN